MGKSVPKSKEILHRNLSFGFWQSQTVLSRDEGPNNATTIHSKTKFLLIVILTHPFCLTFDLSLNDMLL